MKAPLARSAEREQHLLDAATAVFVQRGFYAPRLEEIARAAGVSKRTLAQSFRSKDLLIAALLHRFYEQGVQQLHLLAGTTASATTRIHLFARYMVAGPQQMAALLPNYQTTSARAREAVREFLQDYFREYRAILLPLIEAGVEQGEIHPVDPEEAAAMLAALYEGARAGLARRPDLTRLGGDWRTGHPDASGRAEGQGGSACCCAGMRSPLPGAGISHCSGQSASEQHGDAAEWFARLMAQPTTPGVPVVMATWLRQHALRIPDSCSTRPSTSLGPQIA